MKISLIFLRSRKIWLVEWGRGRNFMIMKSDFFIYIFRDFCRQYTIYCTGIHHMQSFYKSLYLIEIRLNKKMFGNKPILRR